MIVHFMNNALSVFFGFAARRGWAIGNIFTKFGEFISANGVLGLFIFLFMLMLLCYVGFLLLQFMFTQTMKTRFAKRQTDFAKFAMRETYLKEVEDLKNDVPAQDNKNVMPLDEKEFMQYVEDNIDKIIRNSKRIELPTIKMSSKSKIFLIGSIVLSAVMTILTFIWGIL